ncbi:MAG: YdiU family protein [Verrucomicrobiales bacterium]
MSEIAFENSYARLPEHFYAKVQPANVRNPQLIRLNANLAVTLGLDVDWLASPDGLAMLCGNRLPAGAEPIAQAYAGHQFGGWVPQLGDGRAILLGEVLGTDGHRYDIQLKGSGRTPFSRGGDGKAALGPVLREYILSEAMAALGVPTTRALAAVLSGEIVRREQALPGAIFTRVASSHIRVGTFQYFHGQSDTQGLRDLADYAIARHYPAAQNSEQPYRAFLELVIAAQARLIAQWMHLGFIHGVMNTDNMTVSGETIDYGPCAFMDAFHPEKVFSSIDRNGRYGWGNQPVAGHWNLTRLAEALIPLLADDVDDAKATAEAAIATFVDHFSDHYTRGFRAKLGFKPDGENDSNDAFIRGTLTMLAEQKIDYTIFFRQLTKLAAGGDKEALSAQFFDSNSFDDWFEQWREIAQPSAPEFAKQAAMMRAANPVRVPRNHRVEEAIQQAYTGDLTAFNRLVAATADPFEERSEFAEFEQAPTPEQVVCQTFCGT